MLLPKQKDEKNDESWFTTAAFKNTAHDTVLELQQLGKMSTSLPVTLVNWPSSFQDLPTLPFLQVTFLARKYAFRSYPLYQQHIKNSCHLTGSTYYIQTILKSEKDAGISMWNPKESTLKGTEVPLS